MQNKWLTARANPNAQLANTCAASSSSSSSVDRDNDTNMDTVSKPSRDEVIRAIYPNGKVPIFVPRENKPKNEDWPHVNFIELLTQWADVSCMHGDTFIAWLQSNDDFDYCEKHKELVEMTQLHGPNDYNKECSKCLRATKLFDNGVPLTAFFVRQHLSIKTLAEADTIWYGLFKDKEVLGKKLEAAKSTSSPQALAEGRRSIETCSILERSAFLWYFYLAWEKTQYRIAAIKANAARPGESANFNMLPSAAEEDLVKFNSRSRMRQSRTAAGRSGEKKNNVRGCDVHQSKTGHMIHGYSKHRYMECGICWKHEEISVTQRIMDDIGARGGALHPPLEFTAPKMTAQPTKRYMGPSARRQLAAPPRMQSLSLEDEAEMN